MKNAFKGLLTLVCATCMCIVLAGCSGVTSASDKDVQKTPQQLAEEYIISVDSHAAEISKKADEYVKALGESDTVAAKLKFEEITAVLDETANIEIPEAIQDEGEKYKQACTNLKDALNGLNDVANGKVAEGDLQQAVTQAQEKYDAAAKGLEEADSTLKEKVESLSNTQQPQA